MCPCLTCLKSLNGRICDEVGGCTQASQRLADLIWSPTCLCKEVGGFLTKCESIPLESKPWMNELLSYICWYLGQLIMIGRMSGQPPHPLCLDTPNRRTGFDWNRRSARPCSGFKWNGPVLDLWIMFSVFNVIGLWNFSHDQANFLLVKPALYPNWCLHVIAPIYAVEFYVIAHFPSVFFQLVHCSQPYFTLSAPQISINSIDGLSYLRAR